MGAIVVLGVLAVLLAAAVAVAAVSWSRGVVAAREKARLDREQEQARSRAEWIVDVDQSGGYTDVRLIRGAPDGSWVSPGDAMLVASIEPDSPTFEVELERAGIAARQRRDQLNRFLTEGRPDSGSTTG